MLYQKCPFLNLSSRRFFHRMKLGEVVLPAPLRHFLQHADKIARPRMTELPPVAVRLKQLLHAVLADLGLDVLQHMLAADIRIIDVV